MNNIWAVLVYLGLGFIFSKIKKFPQNTPEILNLLVIYVALPALILEKFPLISFNTSMLIPALAPWYMLLISIVVVLIGSKIFKLDKPVTGCLLLVIPLGNTSFLGIPMINSLLGESAIPYAIIYDQVGSFMALSTYGSVIVALYSAGTSSFSLKKALIKILNFPPFIALLMALVLKFVMPPANGLLNIFSVLGSLLVPLAMMSVGFQFKGSFDLKDLPVISGALVFKMIVAPLILFGTLKLLQKTGLPESTAILESGMPPQITAGAVAMSIGLAPKLAAALVGIGILLSFITLPTLQYILKI